MVCKLTMASLMLHNKQPPIFNDEQQKALIRLFDQRDGLTGIALLHMSLILLLGSAG